MVGFCAKFAFLGALNCDNLLLLVILEIGVLENPSDSPAGFMFIDFVSIISVVDYFLRIESV